MKPQQFYICAKYWPDGKFDFYLVDTLKVRRKNSIKTLVDSYSNVTWKQLKSYGVKCIKVTLKQTTSEDYRRLVKRDFFKGWIKSLQTEKEILKTALKDQLELSTDDQLDEWLINEDYK